ncbi:hypothetical protein D3C86_1427700 [compost metagenome]
MQLLVEADAQLQFGGVRPFRQRLFDTVEGEFEDHAVVLAVDAEQLPVQRPYQAVGRHYHLSGLMHGLHLLRVAPQVAEPGPAHRHSTAHALALLEFGLLAEPDQRLFAIALVAENLRALLRDQQFGVGAAHAPAGQLVDFHPLRLWTLSGSVHGCAPRLLFLGKV